MKEKVCNLKIFQGSQIFGTHNHMVIQSKWVGTASDYIRARRSGQHEEGDKGLSKENVYGELDNWDSEEMGIVLGLACVGRCKYHEGLDEYDKLGGAGYFRYLS